MASYPTAVKSFTTKNTGDIYQAAHVNDLQDEVAAIEAGILNGTAPVTSSRVVAPALSVSAGSTLTTLNVTGGSTFATVSVSGGSTFATMSVSGGSTFAVRPTMAPPDVAVVFLDSSGAVGSSAQSTLAWLAQDIVTNSSIHSTATNPERMTPQSTGLYFACLQLGIAGADGGTIPQREIAIVDSSGSTIATWRMKSSAANDRLNCQGYKRFDALGGYLTAKFITNGASSHSLSVGAGISWFSMEKR